MRVQRDVSIGTTAHLSRRTLTRSDPRSEASSCFEGVSIGMAVIASTAGDKEYAGGTPPEVLAMTHTEQTASAAPDDARTASVKTIGATAAGQMGCVIAQVAAASGFQVVLVDAALEIAQRGKA